MIGAKCTNLGCGDPATATVLVGGRRLPKCFTHEREYADRYGPGEVRGLPVGTSVPGRLGRHSSGAGLAAVMEAQYEGRLAP